MLKKLIVLLISIILLVAFTACNEKTSNTDDCQLVEYGVAGYIKEITVSENGSILGTILVEGPKDNGAEYDKAWVTITKDTKIYLNDSTDFNALTVGMYVNIFFEGGVRESYPVQADAKQINIIPNK